MPKTDKVRVYQSKGNSDTLSVVIPKNIRSSLNLQRGDIFQASLDSRGNIVYTRIA